MKKKLFFGSLINYILIQLVVIFVVVLVLGGYLYQFFYSAMYSDFLLVNRQHLEAVTNRHENDMQVVEDIVDQIALTEEATRFHLKGQHEKANELKQHLRRYTTVSQFFSLILYQYHGDNYLYNHFSSVETNFLLDGGMVLSDTSSEELSKVLYSEEVESQILPEQKVGGYWIKNYMDGVDQAVFLIRTVAPEREETLFFIVPASYYNDLLTKAGSDRRCDLLFYDGRIIVRRGDLEEYEAELDTALSGEDFISLSAEEADIQKEIVLGGKLYLLSACMGESGIVYATVQDKTVFYDKIQHQQWTILLMVLLCVFLSVCITSFFSGRMMKKVKNLGKMLKEPSYNLENIEHGVQTLVLMTRKSEKENQDFRKAQFVRNFFRGYLMDRESLLQEAEKAGMHMDYQLYVVALLKDKEQNNSDKIYAKIIQMLNEEDQLEGHGIHLVNNNQNLFVLFADTEEKIEYVLNKMLEIERKYCSDYIFAVSNVHRDFRESTRAYLEADTAFDYRFLQDNSEIIRFSYVTCKEYTTLQREKYMQELRYAIDTGNRDEVELAVNNICQKVKRDRVSLYEFRILYNDMFQLLSSECKGDKLLLDRFYNVFALSQCMNMDEFHSLLLDASLMVLDNQVDRTLKEGSIVDEAISYMRKNYRDPELTMNSLAAYLQISSVVLSIEFKNEMEIEPSRYLNNLRMEEAKRLLRETELMIKDISSAVGYEDVGSFIRRFRKQTGVTPKQYRNEE